MLLMSTRFNQHKRRGAARRLQIGAINLILDMRESARSM